MEPYRITPLLILLQLDSRFSSRERNKQGDTQGGEINYGTFGGEKVEFWRVEIFLPKLNGTRLKIEYDSTNYGQNGEGPCLSLRTKGLIIHLFTL